MLTQKHLSEKCHMFTERFRRQALKYEWWFFFWRLGMLRLLPMSAMYKCSCYSILNEKSKDGAWCHPVSICQMLFSYVCSILISELSNCPSVLPSYIWSQKKKAKSKEIKSWRSIKPFSSPCHLSPYIHPHLHTVTHQYIVAFIE